MNKDSNLAQVNMQDAKPGIGKRVAVGLSGGVDSSVAAYLLKEQGYEVVGVYMQCWEKKLDGCSSDKDRMSAIKVATFLDIKFEYLDFIKEYKERVIKFFYSEYENGRTPNPDILCNKEIKFGMFYDWAMENGFDFVATGHYAQVKELNGHHYLAQAEDASKDQSYFLYKIDPRTLEKVLFPLGTMVKTQVRKVAKEAGLHTFDRPDSVGICFVGEVNIKEFLRAKIPPKKGLVLNTKGEVIGEHDGAWYYTIGQRHGFEINKYVGLPVYVVSKDVDRNELIVGFAGEVVSSEFKVDDLNWLVGKEELDFTKECEVRIRHLGEMFPAKLTWLDSDDLKSDELKLQVKLINCSVFGIASGQSAVFYNKGIVLGGGTIL